MVSFVPTPIGNLGDITLRALEILKEADLIACEDTRHSGKLLKFYEISKPTISLHDHNEKHRGPELASRAAQGTKIAVISDAGTPCLSDPGYRLMQACIENDVPYQVLPGACSITTALVSSGFPPHPFFFGGFLSVKKGKRTKELQRALDRDHTSIYFESPHRIISTLELLRDLNTKVMVCITKELTKKFETIYSGSPPELLVLLSDRVPRGELVMLIAPSDYPK
ncbi:MAG: 16S rRNA (cytidine(1402)-2'-O)-methyltransferase [Akkermansiaceae bacterium]|jgi:16S rRNA (cytidine1402-2'-O)-methyltransferase|nr:16S rRNA (cytidine(1402)-2'-O)-methyltransferase [Akkermansiaceae bacterium]